MNILETIVEYKRKEVAARKQSRPLSVLQKSAHFKRNTFSLAGSLLDSTKTGIIAEFKRKSPSKGIINGAADISQVTRDYARGGAAGLSVLTDGNFFGGSFEDLEKARAQSIPLLQKDFMVDPYQVWEARAMGADVVLLIAACLQPAEVKHMASLAVSLGMEVLLELHEAQELGHICEETKIVGVNNRDLKTFLVDIDRSLAMSRKIPEGKIKVAESGIHSVEMIDHFRNNGFRGFLIGENFMKEPDPGAAFLNFTKTLSAIK